MLHTPACLAPSSSYHPHTFPAPGRINVAGSPGRVHRVSREARSCCVQHLAAGLSDDVGETKRVGFATADRDSEGEVRGVIALQSVLGVSLMGVASGGSDAVILLSACSLGVCRVGHCCDSWCAVCSPCSSQSFDVDVIEPVT